MNIALISDENRQELMVEFCIAYCGILAKHSLCATHTTGRMVAEATGLDVELLFTHDHGGCQQICARIAYDEIDMVFFFTGPKSVAYEEDLHYICHLCDIYNIPCATNIATAEMLIHGLARGDLDWRDVVRSRKTKIVL